MTCTNCNGSKTGLDMMLNEVSCPTCRGTGVINSDRITNLLEDKENEQ